MLFVGCCGVHRFLPGDQVDLAVHHNPALVGEVDHHVRPQPGSLVVDGMLLPLVMRALFQARTPQHTVQHQLAPVTTDACVALERVGQGSGLYGHVLVERLQLAYRTQQAGALTRLFAVNRIHALPEFPELVGKRLQKTFDIHLRLQGGLAYILLELQSALFEDLAGKFGECARQFLLGAVQIGTQLLVGPLRVLEVCRHLGMLTVKALILRSFCFKLTLEGRQSPLCLQQIFGPFGQAGLAFTRQRRLTLDTLPGAREILRLRCQARSLRFQLRLQCFQSTSLLRSLKCGGLGATSLDLQIPR